MAGGTVAKASRHATRPPPPIGPSAAEETSEEETSEEETSEEELERSSSSRRRRRQQQPEGIASPHSHDVLLGRGRPTSRHVGNINFLALVAANKSLYSKMKKKRKSQIALEIVRTVMNQDPPGRFLRKDAENSLWYSVGLRRSVEKTSQALRDKTSVGGGAAGGGPATFAGSATTEDIRSGEIAIPGPLRARFASPHPHDVLLGRFVGLSSLHHVGNLNFLALVAANHSLYSKAKRKRKNRIALEIVRTVMNQDPPGRFLCQDDENGRWYGVGLLRSVERTSQALRENTSGGGGTAGGDASASSSTLSPPAERGRGGNAAVPLGLGRPATFAGSAATEDIRVGEIAIPGHLRARFDPHRKFGPALSAFSPPHAGHSPRSRPVQRGLPDERERATPRSRPVQGGGRPNQRESAAQRPSPMSQGGRQADVPLVLFDQTAPSVERVAHWSPKGYGHPTHPHGDGYGCPPRGEGRACLPPPHLGVEGRPPCHCPPRGVGGPPRRPPGYRHSSFAPAGGGIGGRPQRPEGGGGRDEAKAPARIGRNTAEETSSLEDRSSSSSTEDAPAALLAAPSSSSAAAARLRRESADAIASLLMSPPSSKHPNPDSTTTAMRREEAGDEEAGDEEASPLPPLEGRRRRWTEKRPRTTEEESPVATEEKTSKKKRSSRSSSRPTTAGGGVPPPSTTTPRHASARLRRVSANVVAELFGDAVAELLASPSRSDANPPP